MRPRPRFLLQQYLLMHVEVTLDGNEGPQPQRGKLWVETLSKDPKIMYVHNLISREAAEHLISLASIKGMERAVITPYGSSQLTVSTVRTNSAAWLGAHFFFLKIVCAFLTLSLSPPDYHQDEIVTAVENRIAKITRTRPEQGESVQVLHYQKGQKFEKHRDCYDPAEDPDTMFEQGGNRKITAVIYLRTPQKGTTEQTFPPFECDCPTKMKAEKRASLI